MKKYDDAEGRPDKECEAPTHSGGIERRIEERDGDERADRGADPEAAVDVRSSWPRYLAGMSSWMVELIAAYSPPMPQPVKKRKRKNVEPFQASPVSAVAIR